MKDCQDNQVQTALNIPYFEGDFWSNIIEESIKGMILVFMIDNKIKILFKNLIKKKKIEENKKLKQHVQWKMVVLMIQLNQKIQQK